MSDERQRCNSLSAEWARKQFDKLQPQTQADVRAVLKLLREKGGPAATKKLRALDERREWPSWVILALRDIIGAAWHHKIDL